MQYAKFQKCAVRTFVYLAQGLTGLTFIISGLSKANDPLGMTLLLQNYLSIANIHTTPGSVPVTSMALIMAIIETTLGASLLVGADKHKAPYTLLTLMIPFTLLTAYVAVTEAIPECGCFGSALSLSNTESFAKNIVLLTLAIVLCWRQHDMYCFPGKASRVMITTCTIAIVLTLGTWSWYDLPLIDFTPYSKGTNIMDAMMGEYDVIDGKSVELKAPTIKDFALTTAQGEDVTEEILLSTDTVMLVTIPAEQQADTGNSDHINHLWDEAQDKHLMLYIVFAEGESDAERFKDRTGLACPTLFANQEMLETIVRANPGLVTLCNGVIIDKKAIKNL